MKLTTAQKLLLKNAAENERRKALALMLREEFRLFPICQALFLDANDSHLLGTGIAPHTTTKRKNPYKSST